MNRTRVIFLGFVAVFLALIVVGLLVQGPSEQFVRQLFVATAIFGGGVVALDLFGLLGHHATDAQDAGASVTHDVGHIGHLDHAGDASGNGHVTGHSDAAHGQHDAHAHVQEETQTGQGLLSALAYLRMLVYFCLGFGPMGWAAMGSGWGALRALAVAAPVGMVALFLAQAFFRFQRKNTDSQVAPAELLSQDATVLVPLDDKTMGKVRVQVGLNVSDLYALSAAPGKAFEKGHHVRIERVTDECVYVG